jgi:hypothetical protein
MSWIKRKWQIAALLGLAVAAIAIPAWASSGGDVRRAAEPSGPDGVPVTAGAAASGASDESPMPSRPTRAQLDRALQCMTDHGFGMGAANDRRGVFISRAETKTRAFQRAAQDCGLPPPPTDAQISRIGCAASQARREGKD